VTDETSAKCYWLDEIAPLNKVDDLGDKYAADDEGDPYPAHCILKFRSRYYDAECVKGVKDWRQLPCILNKGKGREAVLKERGEWLDDNDTPTIDPINLYRDRYKKTI
jgi:hypothetical protein